MAHPYQGLPSSQYWNSAMQRSSGVFDVDLMVQPRFRLSGSERIATMGSCFAQHLGRHLYATGLNYFYLEGEPDASGPPAFSCRYGNVYTARHAVQLVQRCLSAQSDDSEIWERDGRFYDAYRPLTRPEGYDSVDALLRDRQDHLHHVRRMVTQTDILIFTLGLTEAWINRETGTAYPSAPGVIAGDFDPTVHSFHNFSVDEVISDLDELLALLRRENPGIRVILTVSPVALAATYEPQHVWVSTTYSKSVLRVAAGTAQQRHEFVDYLPTYEAITAPIHRYRFLAADNRSVEPAGVRHAMRLFSSYMDPRPGPHVHTARASAPPATVGYDVLCDEEFNAP